MNKQSEPPSFEESINPGNIIEFNKNNIKHLGIILANKNVIYFNTQYEFKGYLLDFTKDKPYKILKIRVPSNSVYKLEQYYFMDIKWECSNEKVKISIYDIEKYLGLEHGILEIYY